MKNFIKAKITRTGLPYTDLVSESIRLLSEKGFDVVYVFKYDIFLEKLFIQRFDHVNKCIGSPLNSHIIQCNEGWDAIGEKNDNLYVNTSTNIRISLNTVLSQSLRRVSNYEDISHVIYSVSSKNKKGWKLINDEKYFPSYPCVSLVRDYLWKQVEQYTSLDEEPINDDQYINQQNSILSESNIPIVINRESDIHDIKNPYIGQIVYCTENKKFYIKQRIGYVVMHPDYYRDIISIMSRVNNFCINNFDRGISQDRCSVHTNKMVSVSKLPSYYDGISEIKPESYIKEAVIQNIQNISKLSISDTIENSLCIDKKYRSQCIDIIMNSSMDGYDKVKMLSSIGLTSSEISQIAMKSLFKK